MPELEVYTNHVLKEHRPYLEELYLDQPIAVDKLGGTSELALITQKFNTHCKTSHSEEFVKRYLLLMRKNGKLGKQHPGKNTGGKKKKVQS